jgi:membrane protein implicated in regulation of membrane protease activity
MIQGGASFARRSEMLDTIAVVLILLWALGLVASVTLGGYIHVLIAIALVIILARVINRRKRRDDQPSVTPARRPTP